MSARSRLLPGRELPSTAGGTSIAALTLRRVALKSHWWGFAPVSLCYGLAPHALLTESLGRRGFSLSPTFSQASDRTPELVSASLPRVTADEPPSNWASTSRCTQLYEPRAFARLSPTGKSDERGATPRPLNDQRPDKRLECRGFLKMLQIVSWKGFTSTCFAQV